MLISRVEEEDGLVKAQEASEGSGDDSNDYQTASELFDLMAKKHNFQSHETESLTTRDLILLYKNIDLGTKLMSSANELKRNTPNQYVETIVYHEDSDSDLSEICSNEDLHNVILINKERLDLLENSPSIFGNTLCHKYGDLEIHSSNLTKEYARGFILKDTFNCLQSLDLLPTSKDLDNTILPGSILDYIGCKRLEDKSYNSFYMDSVINYVKNTIDHLKRISDGEYLTEKVKEKWKQEDLIIKNTDHNQSIVLSNSVSIPLHVEQKRIGNHSTWDDIVHSEVNLRSLSKILEKKIVVEVPKNMCGSFKLFGKCVTDNFVITRKKRQQPVLYYDDRERESRVDVVLQLKHSKSGQVFSKISSIMILNKKMDNERTSEVLPLPYEDYNTQNSNQNAILNEIEKERIRNIPIEADKDYNNEDRMVHSNDNGDRKIYDETVTSSSIDRSGDGGSEIDYTTDCGSSPEHLSGYQASHLSGYPESSESSLLGIGHKRNRLKAASLKTSSDDLKLTIHRLSTQGSLPEESLEELACSFNMKKAANRNRMKSPYENKSHAIEERKRKRLLEIKQRREKRKIAMIETYKATKCKHGRGFMSQPSSSVTKLSITNKSFYDSIYGQSSDDKLPKIKIRKLKKESSFEEISDTENDNEGDRYAPDINSQKYINKNYFLDETVTEMMYIEMKQKESEEQDLNSESLGSNDFNTKLNILSQLITPSITDLSVPDAESMCPFDDYSRFEEHDDNTEDNNKDQTNTNSYLKKVTPEASEKTSKNIKFQLETEEDAKKSNKSSMEFRKSIDKIYELMNKLGKGPENKLCKSKFTAVQTGRGYATRNSSPTTQYNESDSSIKEHTSTDPSLMFNMGKVEDVAKLINKDLPKSKNMSPKNSQSPSTIVPKVVISSKSQTIKGDAEKTKRDRKKMTPNKSVSENPLKAISQILHEFDNVQKTRNKTVTIDTKPKKAEVISAEGKIGTRQSFLKKPFFADSRTGSAARENRTKSNDLKLCHQQPPNDDKQINRSIKKQVADLMDEFKEARGEAIRGPRPSARLNSLAQPKRTYVQAQIEDYQAKHGKSVVADRLLRLTGSSVPDTSARNRFRRVDVTGSAKNSSPPPPPSERTSKSKAFSSSRETKTPQSANEQCLKQHKVSELSGTLNKKMVAVESYVKNHYGRSSHLVDNNDLRGVQKTRANHPPIDFKLSPPPSTLPEDNCFLLGGNKYHTVDSLGVCQTSLAVVTECNETTSEHSKDNKDDSNGNDLIIDCYMQNNLETQTNTNIKERSVEEHITSQFINAEHDSFQFINAEHDSSQFITADSSRSITAGQEDTFNQQFQPIIPSVCTIQKRLNIENFSMPPKEQMQKIYKFVLQSDDSKSSTDLLYRLTSTVNTSISQSSQVIKSKSDIMKDMKTLAGFTKIGFGLPAFPMPIATVGYCFPNYHPDLPCTSSSSLVATIGDMSCPGISSYELSRSQKSDKTSQCFKGMVEPVIDDEVQTECKDNANSSKSNVTDNTFAQPKGDNVMEYRQKTTIIESKRDTEEDRLPNNAKVPILTKIETGAAIDVLSNNSKPSPTISKSPSSELENVEYTTSLDILVGLLNEIQKITTCQTQITNPTHTSNSSVDNVNNFETILKDSSTVALAAPNKPQKKISITTIEELRRLDSKASIFYLSNNTDGDLMDKLHHNLDNISKPISVDKQVSAEQPRKEFTNSFTEVPSRFFPSSENHGTDISRSLIGVLSEPSTPSMITYGEHILHSNASLQSLTKIIELPQNMEKNVQRHNLFKGATKEIRKVSKKSSNKTSPNSNEKEIIAICATKKLTTDYSVQSESDPTMKMKRDILVTVYSVLVFTVFAALSFPEMLYRL